MQTVCWCWMFFIIWYLLHFLWKSFPHIEDPTCIIKHWIFKHPPSLPCTPPPPSKNIHIAQCSFFSVDLWEVFSVYIIQTEKGIFAEICFKFYKMCIECLDLELCSNYNVHTMNILDFLILFIQNQVILRELWRKDSKKYLVGWTWAAILPWFSCRHHNNIVYTMILLLSSLIHVCKTVYSGPSHRITHDLTRFHFFLLI